MKVVVTGAGGRTGGLIIKQLSLTADTSVVGTVRSKASSNKLQFEAEKATLVELDLAAAVAAAGEADNAAVKEFAAALQGADALVIATSGVPQIKHLSLLGVIAGRLVGRKIMPGFTWKKGELPEQIDWLGQKVQIDAAKAAGVKQVVLISSMGGTDPDHFLNKMGGNARILDWKRKAEQYLIASGVPYTIIHPGGLIDEAGGAKQLVLGVDDKLMDNNPRNIPRADVATLAISCIGLKEALNKSFDVIGAPLAAGAELSNDPAALLAALHANCDYSINSQA